MKRVSDSTHHPKNRSGPEGVSRVITGNAIHPFPQQCPYITRFPRCRLIRLRSKPVKVFPSKSPRDDIISPISSKIRATKTNTVRERTEEDKLNIEEASATGAVPRFHNGPSPFSSSRLPRRKEIQPASALLLISSAKRRGAKNRAKLWLLICLLGAWTATAKLPR